MKVRAANSSDWQEIWQIMQQVIAKEDTYVFSADTSEADAKKYWFAEGVSSFICEDQEKIVGIFKILANQRDLGSHVANASFMVDPNTQGKGIGRFMGMAALEQARLMKFFAMQFNFVVSTNAVAIKLWQDLGFEIVGTLPRAFRHKELGFVDVYVMYQLL